MRNMVRENGRNLSEYSLISDHGLSLKKKGIWSEHSSGRTPFLIKCKTPHTMER